MHYTTLLASALAVGTLAVPYNNNFDLAPAVTDPPSLDKRAQFTEADFRSFFFYFFGFQLSQANVWQKSGFAPLAPSTRRTSTFNPTAVAAALQTSSSTTRTSSSSVRLSSSTTRPTTSSSTRLSTSTQIQVTLESPLQASVIPTSTSRASTTAVTSAAAAVTHISGTSQASLSSGVEYQNAVLFHHNARRANHNASPLTWGADLEANARLVAQNCTFAHYIPPGVSNGQNLFTTSGNFFNVTAGITESWYKSEFPPMLPYFGQANIPSTVFHSVGHLTQLVWKGTTKVGCVSYDCGTRMIVNGQISTLNKYTVCNYSPPGNVATQYAINVGSPISTTNLGSWTD